MTATEVTLLSPERLDQFFGSADSEEIQEKVSELKNMHYKVEDSDGQLYRDLLNDVNRTKRMLEENYTELMSSINHFEENPETWLFDEDELVQDALLGFSRKLHNYLAVCLSLRDHTYRAKDKLSRGDLNKKYNQKLRDFDLLQHASFIINLREYVQHRRVPVVTGRTTTHVTREAPVERNSKILIDKEQLLEWENWDDEALEVLDNLDEEFQIQSVIQEYHRKLDDYYEWFFEYVTDLYEDDIENRNELIVRMARIQESIMPGINEEFLEEHDNSEGN